MKRKALLMTYALTIVTLTGCYPTGEIDTSDSVTQYITETANIDADEIDDINGSEDETSDKSTYGADLKNVIVNLTLPEAPEKVTEFDGEPRSWDNESLKRLFLEAKGEVTEDSFESDMTPEEMRYVFSIPDQYRLTTESGYIKYSNLGNTNRDEYTMLQSSWMSDEMDKIFGDKELEGFSSDAACEELSQLLLQCGISDYGEPIIYPLHAKNVNQYFADYFSTMEHKDGSPYQVNWTESEEAYLIVYPQIINGGESTIEISMDSTYADAIVTRNGVTEFYVTNWKDIITSGAKETDLVYSSTAAANILIDYYESIIQETPIELCNCRLTMYPDSGEGEKLTHFIPVWEFSVKTQVEEGQFLYSRRYISVSSGKQILGDVE